MRARAFRTDGSSEPESSDSGLRQSGRQINRSPISIRCRGGIWSTVALNKSATSEVESFDLFIYFVDPISITHSYIPIFPPQVGSPVSSISWCRAERGVPQALSAGWSSTPPSPVQLQREGEDIFIVPRSGHFHGSCTVAQLFLHFGIAGERKSCWDLRGGGRIRHQHRLSDPFQSQR